MRKNKVHGFTLIELLAVIVILAIIALIATPIVLDIIDDSKKSSVLRSADFYLDGVEFSIANSVLDNSTIKDGTYYVIADGNICLETYNTITKTCIDTNEDDKVDVLKVDVNGEVPSIGSTIDILNGNIDNVFLIYGTNGIEKDESKELTYIKQPESFETDDWDTIVKNVRAGNLSKYKVGDTKEVALTEFTNGESGSNGLYTVRISNISIPEECMSESFSQTACGFVIEFVDIITTHNMNPADTEGNSTVVGGWELSAMRKYVNEDIYSALEEELKDIIIDTYVVSGYESGKTENYKTIDKLYLLSPKEIYAVAASSDKVADETRQLDYYSNLGVTTTDYAGAIKKRNGSATLWWLRSVIYGDNAFYIANSGGRLDGNAAKNIVGVAVSFRIG